MGRSTAVVRWGWVVRGEEALASLGDFGGRGTRRGCFGMIGGTPGLEVIDPIVGRGRPRVKGGTPLCRQERVPG